MTLQEENILVQLLSDRDHTCRDVTTALKISQGTFKRIIDSLIIDGLVDSRTVVSNKILAYFLTNDGMVAANQVTRNRAKQGEIVPPRKVEIPKGIYEPTQCYQRNNGLKHIQSRGF